MGLGQWPCLCTGVGKLRFLPPKSQLYPYRFVTKLPRSTVGKGSTRKIDLTLRSHTTSTTAMSMTKQAIRQILTEQGRLSVDVATLSDDADLYQAGMTSHASVNIMLALEGEFDLEFPDRMLKRSVFESISAISDAIEELKAA